MTLLLTLERLTHTSTLDCPSSCFDYSTKCSTNNCLIGVILKIGMCGVLILVSMTTIRAKRGYEGSFVMLLQLT